MEKALALARTTQVFDYRKLPKDPQTAIDSDVLIHAERNLPRPAR